MAIYGFERATAERLQRIADRDKAPGTEGAGELPSHRPRQDPRICKTPSGGIPARSGTSVSSVLCDVYYIDHNDAIVSAGYQISVYNLSQSAVQGDAWITTDRIRGKHVCIFEDCPP